MIYEIPGFSKYTIDEDGEIFNKDSEKYLQGSLNGGGYHFYHLIGDDGEDHNVGRHRLVALARIDKPISSEKLIVNHKDCVKLNCDVNNLEWCTYRENLIHAGQNGLTSKVCSVQLRNVKTGQIYSFDAMVACAKALGISKDAVNFRCRQGPSRVFPDGHQYRTPISNEPWPHIENIEIALLENGTKQFVLVKDIQTGEIHEFHKLEEAASFLMVSPSNLTAHFKRSSQPLIRRRYHLKKGVDASGWNKPVSLDKKQLVRVTDVTTGESIEYQTAQAAANANGLLTTTLDYRLKFRGAKAFNGKTYERIFRINGLVPQRCGNEISFN